MHKNCKEIGFRSYNNVEFCIDTDLYEEIMSFENSYREKLIDKLSLSMSHIDIGTIKKDKYSMQSKLLGTFHISAFKFKSERFNNARIYCQDIAKTNNQKRKIILCEMLASKKQNEHRQKEKSIIYRIKETNYDYL